MSTPTSPSPSPPEPPIHHPLSSSPNLPSPPSPTPTPTPPHHLIHLIQCLRCSLPLRTPLRLPCGNTFCRACLPPTRTRPKITYPATEGRELGFDCWFLGRSGCAGEHCVGDCGVDVLMTKLVGVFEEVLGCGSAEMEMGKEEKEEKEKEEEEEEEREAMKVIWQDGDQARDAVLRRRGRLDGIYGLVKEGRFGYGSLGVEYHGAGQGGEGEDISSRLKEGIRNELDCHVCYSLILDPLTTPCGHTFCRSCIVGIMNHSDLCPVCRRKLNMLSNLHAEPTNRNIAGLIDALFPDQVAARREGISRDEAGVEERTIPLFVCTLSFPGMPTFLHVYERRYRLMMRRVMAGGRKFGMVTYNRGNRMQGDMGRAPFMQYGTMLIVDRFEMLPDGRSLVIAHGVSRFRVTKTTTHEDGYQVGSIERVDDISLTEEETYESMEVSRADDSPAPSEGFLEETPLGSMSTRELFELGMNYVRKQRNDGAGWLHPRVLMAYGDVPTDPGQFAWWLANVLPVPEDEKYALLPTTSVRDRLKITARWIRKLEANRWYVYTHPPGLNSRPNVFVWFTFRHSPI